MHCSTVAVPAFVYSTTIVYVIWEGYSPATPSTAKRAKVARSRSIARTCARWRTSSTAKNSKPAPSMRAAVMNTGEAPYPAIRNCAHAPEKPHSDAPTKAAAIPRQKR